ncbi:MAG: hypothetical protein AAGJ19_15095 [Myxococcota bacterium]
MNGSRDIAEAPEEASMGRNPTNAMNRMDLDWKPEGGGNASVASWTGQGAGQRVDDCPHHAAMVALPRSSQRDALVSTCIDHQHRGQRSRSHGLRQDVEPIDLLEEGRLQSGRIGGGVR